LTTDAVHAVDWRSSIPNAAEPGCCSSSAVRTRRPCTTKLQSCSIRWLAPGRNQSLGLSLTISFQTAFASPDTQFGGGGALVFWLRIISPIKSSPDLRGIVQRSPYDVVGIIQHVGRKGTALNRSCPLAVRAPAHLSV